MSVAASGQVINSGAMNATSGSTGAGTAAVTRPAPTRNAANAAIAGAPDLPTEPPTTSTWPKLPLLAVAARGVCVSESAEPAHVRFEFRDHRLFRRTDGRDDDGLRPMPRELAEDVRRFGRCKSNDRIGGKDRTGHRCAGLIRRPAAGQVNGENGSLAALDPFERGQSQAFERRLEAGADNGIEDQVGFERGLVLGQVFRLLDDVDQAVRRDW